MRIAPTDPRRVRLRQPFGFGHDLVGEPLLSLGGLARAAGEMPCGMVEGTAWTGSASKPRPLAAVEAEAAVEAVASGACWLILRNLEQLDGYRQLMSTTLAAVRRLPRYANLEILRPMCFAFVSSPAIRVPLHIDPEHNFLYQIQGTKTLWLPDLAARRLISRAELRRFYLDETGFEFEALDETEAALRPWPLRPGLGVYVPVTAPHRVTNDDLASVAFSVTFRTLASERQRLACLRAPAPLSSKGEASGT